MDVMGSGLAKSRINKGAPGHAELCSDGTGPKSAESRTNRLASSWVIPQIKHAGPGLAELCVGNEGSDLKWSGVNKARSNRTS